MSNNDLLHTAVCALAKVCDYAQSEDGAGFNGVDARFGHHLAEKPVDKWTWRDRVNAYKMIAKYRKQLMAYGVDYDQIPQPLTNGEGRYISVKNGRLIIEFPYDANLVTAVKALPGRSFDPVGKFWTCPISSKTAVLQFAESRQFSIDPSLFGLDEVVATPEPEQPKRPFAITVSNNELVISFEYDPALVERVKALSDRRFNNTDKSWRVPVRLAADVVTKFPQAQISPAVLELAGQQKQLASMSKSATSDFEVPGLKGEPLPYQRAGVQFVELTNGRAIIADQMGLGKAQPVDAKILTPGGWVLMGDIKSGDRVINSEGGESCVIGIYPQGVKDVYSVTFSDGSVTECCDDHLWLVNSPYRRWYGNPPRIKTLKEIRTHLRDGAGNHQHFIPMIEPVEFDEHPLPLDPYLLGVLLGDGSMSRHHVSLSTAEREMVDTISGLLPEGVTLKYRSGYDWSISSPKAGTPNPIIRVLSGLGLMGSKSETKFLPDVYKFSAIKTRLAVLRGLLDTDGHVRPVDNNIEYTTVSKQLALDVQFLVQSLGGTAPIRTKETGKQLAYRMSIALPKAINPFLLKRKANTYHPRKKYPPSRCIISVELIGKKLCQCIAVDALDSLYITDSFIVTHNTLQSLAWLQLHPEKRPCVIVCPASLKINWRREIGKWMTTPERIVILDGRKSHSLAGLGSLFIINYDVLKYWLDAITAIEPKVLICDEGHFIKNKSQRSEAVKTLSSKIPHVIMLTGTPITNRPRELFPLLNAVDPVAWPKFFPFGKRYCNGHQTRFGWDFSGASNLEELHEKIRPYVVRRTKDQVLKELPAKRRVTLPIEISDQDRREYNGLISEAKTSIQETQAAGGTVGTHHLALIEKAKQITARGKLPAVIEWIKDFIESDKLILFCIHKFVVDALMKEFVDTAVKVTGDDSQTQRQAAVDNFQNDPEVKLFIGNIQAAGVGLTLTAASNVAFLELPWVPGEVEQAEDRAHRIGQVDSVTCWYLVAEDTIDEQIASLLESKRQVVDIATDGKVGKLSLSVFGELINQLTKQED